MKARVGVQPTRAERRQRVEQLLKLGMTRGEIAARLGIDPKTVSNLMHRKGK